MSATKLLVVSVDAMVGEDIEYVSSLPTFSRLLENAAFAEVEAVFPTLTYPNHAAQLTGCPPAVTGVYNNLKFQPWKADPDWFWNASDVRVGTVLDAAKAAGMTTAALQWPATANADIDLLFPEVWVADGWGSEQALFQGTCSPRGFEKYYHKHRDKIVWGPGRHFNEFACSIAEEILADEQPDVMFLHLVAVDAARHLTGPFTPAVNEALEQVDGWLGRLVSAMEKADTLDATNIVIVSDHGHLETVQHTNLNTIFKERGFLRLDDSGQLLDYDIFCHSAGLSAQLFLATGLAADRRAEVQELLKELVMTPEYRIEAIHTANETLALFGLGGPFDYVVESEPGVLLGTAWDGPAIAVPGDAHFTGYIGNHGHNPRHGAQPVFLATGPAFEPGADAGRRSMLDLAPTFAAVLGVPLPSAHGVAMTELLAPAREPMYAG